MVNLSQSYRWFILRNVMLLGISSTVVIHVANAKLGRRLTADCVVVIHVPYAICEAVRQYITLLSYM